MAASETELQKLTRRMAEDFAAQHNVPAGAVARLLAGFGLVVIRECREEIDRTAADVVRRRVLD